MIPQFALLETPPEYYYLEEMFVRHHYPTLHAEKVMKTLLFLMRNRQNVEQELPGWIDRFRQSEHSVGELLYRPIEALGQNFHHLFTSWGMYLPDGQMPYAYVKQDAECTLFKYDIVYHSLNSR